MVNVGFGLDRDQAIEEIEVDVQLDEEEKPSEEAAAEEEIKVDDLEVEDLGSAESEGGAAKEAEQSSKQEDL